MELTIREFAVVMALAITCAGFITVSFVVWFFEEILGDYDTGNKYHWKWMSVVTLIIITLILLTHKG